MADMVKLSMCCDYAVTEAGLCTKCGEPAEPNSQAFEDLVNDELPIFLEHTEEWESEIEGTPTGADLDRLAGIYADSTNKIVQAHQKAVTAAYDKGCAYGAMIANAAHDSAQMQVDELIKAAEVALLEKLKSNYVLTGVPGIDAELKTRSHNGGE